MLALTHVLSNWISEAFYGPIQQRFGVTLAEWRVILTLIHVPDATAKQIVARWAMDKMAVSRAIRALEASGRLARRRDPTDRRSYTLELTPSGRALYDQILPSAAQRHRDIVSALSKQELAAFRAALVKLIQRTSELAD